MRYFASMTSSLPTMFLLLFRYDERAKSSHYCFPNQFPWWTHKGSIRKNNGVSSNFIKNRLWRNNKMGSGVAPELPISVLIQVLIIRTMGLLSNLQSE